MKVMTFLHELRDKLCDDTEITDVLGSTTDRMTIGGVEQALSMWQHMMFATPSLPCS